MSVPASAVLSPVRPHAVVAAVCLLAGVEAQELLQPQAAVFGAFPAADGYRTVQRDVGHDQRRGIETRVPFPIRFDALGRHSLYVALRGREPIGVLMVRTEEGASGLTEFQWALDLERRIVGWQCQRVRDRHAQVVRDSEFARRLVGQGGDDLRLAVDGSGALQPGVVGVPPGSEPFCALTVRSALVGIAVVEVVWASEVERLRDLQLGIRSFPGAVAVARQVLTAEGRAETAPRLERLLAVTGEQRRLLGHVAELRDGDAAWFWAFDPARTVQAMLPAAGLEPEQRARLVATAGGSLPMLARRDDAIGAAARSVQRNLPPVER